MSRVGLGLESNARRIGEATVKTHVANILQKLALKDRVQIVVFAYDQGIVTTKHRAGGRR